MLEDKVAIVTGAGQGIGAATARRMAEEGAKVVVSDVNAETGKAVVARSRRPAARRRSCAADVSRGRRRQGADGGDHGRVRPARRPPQQRRRSRDQLHDEQAQSYELPEDVWDKVIGINLKGRGCARSTRRRC